MNNQAGESVAVVGAGIMGTGIAHAFASNGFGVFLVDMNPMALDKAKSAIAGILAGGVRLGKVTDEQAAATLARIHGAESLASAQADTVLAIETATENLAVKQAILRQMEQSLNADTIFATNTSALSITEIASAVKSPGRVVGMHFFNPVPMMALVEVIRGLQTNDESHAAVQAFALALGKTPITVKNAPGFVVNRILVPMINEAFFVLGEGIASAEDIDQGMKLGCNHPIGPLALADLVGLDVCLAVMEVYFNSYSDSKYRAAPLLREMVAAGRLGRKSGHGVYCY